MIKQSIISYDMESTTIRASDRRCVPRVSRISVRARVSGPNSDVFLLWMAAKGSCLSRCEYSHLSSWN